MFFTGPDISALLCRSKIDLPKLSVLLCRVRVSALCNLLNAEIFYIIFVLT